MLHLLASSLLLPCFSCNTAAQFGASLLVKRNQVDILQSYSFITKFPVFVAVLRKQHSVKGGGNRLREFSTSEVSYYLHNRFGRQLFTK